MIDIIGNLKIDESKPERVKYLLACIKSFAFLKDDCTFILNLESPTYKLYKFVEKTLQDCGYEYHLTIHQENTYTYGKKYIELLKKGRNDFVLNFIEDAFCLIDDKKVFEETLFQMRNSTVDILRASFFQIETLSVIPTLTDKWATFNTPSGHIFRMTPSTFDLFQKHYTKRYYIGVNFITTREFAVKFWSREFDSNRPHEWEISEYDSNFEHTCMVPSVEFLACIDSDHGEENSHLLARKEEKFWRICQLPLP